MAKSEVSVNIGELFITVSTEHDYPDVVDDLVSRARVLCFNMLNDIKTVGVDIHDLFEHLSIDDFENEDEYDDDEAEDA